MSDIKQEIFQAIEVIVKEENKKLKFAKTIEATIYDAADAASGKYLVKYQDSIFPAYSNDVNLRYAVDDIVLVLVPDSDFGKQKTIIGKKGAAANDGEAEMVPTQSILEKIDYVGPDWSVEEMTGYGDEIIYPIGLKAGQPDESVKIFEGFQETQEAQIARFVNYFNKCSAFLIKADFQTAFPSDNQDYRTGNYGVRVVFEKDGTQYRYELDVSHMNGDAYNFTTPATQYIVFEYDNEALKDAALVGIEVFEQGFDLEEGEEPDIFVSNLELRFVDEIEADDTGYSVYISTPQGNMITSTDIQLIPNLKLNGILVDFDSASWYVRDISVNVGSENFDSAAGLGWRKITPSEGVNGNTLILNNTADNIGHTIFTSTELKVVIFNNEDIYSKMVEVYPLTSQYDFSLEVDYDSDNRAILKVVSNDGDLLDSYSYSWMKIDAAGLSYFLQEGKESTYTFNINEVYLNNTFYCSVFNADGQLLGTPKLMISKSIETENATILFTGNHFYTYDTNGDIDINVANKQHELGFELYTPAGERIQEAAVKWDFPDPERSMIKLAVNNGKSVTYNVDAKYNINKLNNVITVTITDYNDNVYQFTKEIICLKTGNTGTNGTKYAAVIDFVDSVSNHVKKGDQTQVAALQLMLYEDGVSLDASVYDIEWSIIGGNRDKVLITGSLGENGVYTAKFNSIYDEATDEELITGVSAVKAEISVGDYKLDVFKAIPVLVSGTEYEDIGWIDFVEYNPAGEEPVWNKNLFIPAKWETVDYLQSDDVVDIKNTIYFDQEKIRTFSETTNLPSTKEKWEDFVYTTNEETGEAAYPSNYSLIPLDKYDNSGLTANVLLQSGQTKILWPVLYWLNTYGNKAINDWDGVSVNINEEQGYILTPMVGAGEKNSLNEFTGALMGTVGYFNGDHFKKSTGLFGYSKGVQTFSIDSESGNMRLGASDKGGITIDAENSILSTYEFTKPTITANTEDGYYTLSGGVGTKIDLGEGNIYTPQFVVENGNAYFSGHLSAASGSFEGRITAKSGSIGGWTISNNSLSSGDLYLNGEEGYIQGPGFTLNQSGGSIGGWNFNDSSISAGSISLNSDGTADLGALRLYISESTKFTYLEGAKEGVLWGMSGDNPKLAFYAAPSGEGGGSTSGFGVYGLNGELWGGGYSSLPYYSSDRHSAIFSAKSDGVHAGKFFFSSTESTIKVYNGSEWVDYAGGSGSGDGNVRYAPTGIWSYTDENGTPNSMTSSVVFDNESWKGLYLTTTGTGSSFAIDTIRLADMEFQYGLCVSDSADKTVSDANFKAAFKTWLGSSSEGSGLIATNGGGTWWYKAQTSAPDGMSVLTSSAKNQEAATYVGISGSTIQLWNIGLTNGLVTTNDSANDNYTSTFASIIAGYL